MRVDDVKDSPETPVHLTQDSLGKSLLDLITLLFTGDFKICHSDIADTEDTYQVFHGSLEKCAKALCLDDTLKEVDRCGQGGSGMFAYSICALQSIYVDVNSNKCLVEVAFDAV